MKIGKILIQRIINEEIQKINLSELFTKRAANLDSIVDEDMNPSKNDILNSEDFQKTLINDLIHDKRNVIDFTSVEKQGSLGDIEKDQDSFPINYEFDFIYPYKETNIKLKLFVNGSVDINWIGKYTPATHWQPAEYPQPEIDGRILGKNLEISLYDDDGTEIQLPWITPNLKSEVAKSIISPYL